MIFCPKCGEAIPDESITCPKCGVELKKEDEQAVVYVSQAISDADSSTNSVKANGLSKVPKSVKIAIGVVALLAIVFFVVNEMGKASLKKELLRDWMDIDDGIIKVLDFSDNKVEYRLETGYSWMDMTVGKYDYKVVSKNKIKINMFGDKYETYTIEFNDDKNMITVTPAITSVDSKENWFNLDDY